MIQTQIILALLVLARVSAFIAFFSLFSNRQLPNTVKIGLAVGLTFFWYGQVDGTAMLRHGAPEGLLLTFLSVIKEVTIGLVLATAMSAFFLPAKIAGAYVGQELGLSLASVADPASPDSSTMLTRIFESLAVLVFFSMNLHHFLILVIDTTYHSLAGQIHVLDLPSEAFVLILSRVSDYGILIIAPIGVLLMLVTCGLALLNKAAPTLNLFSVGMSIRSGFGVLGLFLFLPVILNALRMYLFRIQDDIQQLLLAF
jgi:flagellar biosynthetic protein FliR